MNWMIVTLAWQLLVLRLRLRYPNTSVPFFWLLFLPSVLPVFLSVPFFFGNTHKASFSAPWGVAPSRTVPTNPETGCRFHCR